MARQAFRSLALASGILFGLAAPASKVLVGDLGPFALAGLLYLGAAMAMLPALGGKALRPAAPDGRRLVGVIVLGGIAGPTLLLLGLQVARASSVSVWLNLELAWTAILGLLLFRERSSRWSWAAVVFVIGASLAVGWAANPAGLLAGSLVAAACLCWGFDNHWTARIRSLPATVMTFWKGLVGGAVNLTAGLVLGSQIAPAQAATGLAVGAICYGVSIVLYIVSARKVGATRAQVLFSTAPLWGVLVAVVWLGDPWTWRLGLAAALVGAAVGALTLDSRANPPSEL